MSIALLISAIVAFASCLIHALIGGREVVPALFSATELKLIPKLTLYYCWHIVTGMLFTLALAIAYASFQEPGNLALIIFCLLLASGCAVWSIGLAIASGRTPWELPQWTLFLGISLPILWHLVLG